mgnify:CR=1 FL=1
MSDNFTRSLAHWSEAGRSGMEAFYRLAAKDYRHLAEARDWAGWLESRQARTGDRRLRLLDVACGSGKFPAALIKHAGLAEAGLEPIDYDLLDPAAFSVEEARNALAPPFAPAGEHVCTLQDLRCEPGAFDIVWATHALYALPRAELDAGLARFVDAIAPDGAGFIAQSSEAGHYLRFHRAFLEGFDRGATEPYTAAEDLTAALSRLGVSFETEEITYENGAPDAERDAVEGYLQRCLFEDEVCLDALQANPVTGAYLATCRHGDAWRFSQTVTLISIG